MGLLDRIKDEQSQRFLEEVTEERQTGLLREEELKALTAIIEAKLKTLSDELEVEFVVIESGKFFQLGDLVLHVQPYQQGGERLNPSKPKFAIMNYVVSLIGVDIRTGRLDKYRVGSVKFLNYNGLYKAVTENEVLQFEAALVLEQRDQFGIFG